MQIAPYFSKVECFCFEEQKLLAGEEVDMPLLSSSSIKTFLDDPACRGVDDVVLSPTHSSGALFLLVPYFCLGAHWTRGFHLDYIAHEEMREDTSSLMPATKRSMHHWVLGNTSMHREQRFGLKTWRIRSHVFCSSVSDP